MRRLVSLLVLVVLAFTLVGCGGGGDARRDRAKPPAPAETAAPAPVEGADDRRPLGQRDHRPSSRSPRATFVPADLKSAIDAKQPTLIFFYDSSHTSKHQPRHHRQGA